MVNFVNDSKVQKANNQVSIIKKVIRVESEQLPNFPASYQAIANTDRDYIVLEAFITTVNYELTLNGTGTIVSEYGEGGKFQCIPLEFTTGNTNSMQKLIFTDCLLIKKAMINLSVTHEGSANLLFDLVLYLTEV